MGDHLVRAEEFEKKADKKLNGWGLFGSKYEDAADLLEKAANSYKLAKAWDRAGATYVKMANCHLKSDSKHDAANAYAEAAKCYKKVNTNEAASCLEQAVNIFCEIGRLSMAARYYKEIAEYYESDQNINQAIAYFEKAAEFFQNEEVATSANQCKLKVAQYAAQMEQYDKAIQIYEEIGRQSLNNNLLKYGVKGHLLNAGICHLCKSDVVSISNALEKYQDLDPTFSGTRECKFLTDIASAIDEEDVARFTDVVKEFDSMTPLDSWKTTLLLRVKEKLKAKELEEDDLT
ncbi:PREDICTED: alpha-soluble NSF attachment protein 2-like [Tarenaya hassleriana]|uniref:alpha-soluble NSF attachment protein 2-like n=1 Tax=Tarenaya hassleriana TaxID=28532 RepID=UPI00053CA8A9|nr:PREDICTED: alpha-soluble NSF attachment protein 2-like [Tarenaya hassleriana]